MSKYLLDFKICNNIYSFRIKVNLGKNLKKNQLE